MLLPEKAWRKTTGGRVEETEGRQTFSVHHHCTAVSDIEDTGEGNKSGRRHNYRTGAEAALS